MTTLSKCYDLKKFKNTKFPMASKSTFHKHMSPLNRCH